MQKSCAKPHQNPISLSHLSIFACFLTMSFFKKYHKPRYPCYN